MAAVSLREQLTSLFPTDPTKVDALVGEYFHLILANPGWRIGGYIAFIKANLKKEKKA